MESQRFFTPFCFGVALCLSLGCETPQAGQTEATAKPIGQADSASVPLTKSESPTNVRSASGDNNASPSSLDSVSPKETQTEELDSQNDDAAIDDPAGLDEKPREPTIDIPDHWKRLSPTHEIWLDKKNKQVVVGGQICLTAGQLEMLMCPRNTKEHESIISARVESWQVHAALEALGVEQGEACKWDPEYAPAWGPKIEIEVLWKDPKSGQVNKIDGKQWILDVKTQKPMELDLVFGGSLTETNEETGENYYTGNDGALICLANFSTGTIDIRVEDAQTQAFFEANTPKIPALGTQVYALIRGGEVIGKPTDSDR